MGKSVFICPVPTPRALDDAIRAVVEHNVTESKKLGVYSDEEFAALDPRRSQVFAAIQAQLDQTDSDVETICGAKDRRTRGGRPRR